MGARSKIYASFEDAVRDIPDGATLGFGGFAVVGMPINLYQAVARQGAKELTCVSNSTRGGATLPADAPDLSGLIRNGQVKKVICAFTAPTRASQRLVLTEYVAKGLIEAESLKKLELQGKRREIEERLARREELARMRIEREDSRRQRQVLRGFAEPREHRLMPAVDAVEIADRQRDGTVGRSRQAANHPHDLPR